MYIQVYYYPACNGHALFCIVVWTCTTLQHFVTLSHKWHDSRKKKDNINVCSDFLYNFWNITHSKKNSARYYDNLTTVVTSNTRYSCQIWTKVRFSRQIFEKYPNTNFHKNLSNGNWVVTCRRKESQPARQTDRHDEANSNFSQFFECA